MLLLIEAGPKDLLLKHLLLETRKKWYLLVTEHLEKGGRHP